MSFNRPTNLNFNDALKNLVDGNKRFVDEKSIHPNSSIKRRKDLVDGQKPYAIILSCADSRVCPELLFDSGLGDLFTIRVAGNILDEAVLGSIEYAVIELGVNLIVVLGHESCGAVKAAISGKMTNLHIDELIKHIAPAIEKVEGNKEEKVEECIKSNVRFVKQKLLDSKDVIQKIPSDELKILTGYYKLENGLVEFDI